MCINYMYTYIFTLYVYIHILYIYTYIHTYIHTYIYIYILYKTHIIELKYYKFSIQQIFTENITNFLNYYIMNNILNSL